jgi:acyl-CoA thioesterase FadM
MLKYTHDREFRIKYCETDFKDELKLSSVLAYFEEVAGSSADELGFGYQDLKPREISFMLSGICCEFYAPIMQGEDVTFRTWPLPPSYVVFGREYEAFSKANGMKLCSATSRWCLVDLNSGKVLQSKEVGGQDYSTYNLDRALEWNNWKIPVFDVNDDELRYSMTVANSEYDHNLHVNNTHYADYCLNCFSVSELRKKRLRRFQISFSKQCKEGDELRFYRKECEKGEYIVRGVNQLNETVVLTRFNFEENL